MKLLIDARSLGEKPSGIGIYIYMNCIYMIKENNIEIALVTDVCESDEIKKLMGMGTKVFSIGKKIKKSLSLIAYYRFVQKCIYKYKPDVFWEANQMTLIKMKNPFGILATTIHDVFPITCPKYFGMVYPIYFRYCLNKTLRTFDCIIYDSLESKNECEKVCKTSKIPSHIGYAIVRRPPEINLKNNESFLYIGNLENRKGTDILLEAFEEYIKNGGDRSLRLVGKIRDKDIDIKIQTMLHKYPNQLKYLGYISEKEKEMEYASCGTFVFPSRAEGFGIPIIEAMCYRKKIIASNLSIFKEIVGDSIKLFDISGEKKDSVKALVKLLEEDLQNRGINEMEYNRIVDHYTDGHFAKEILGFFKLRSRK